MRIYYVTLNTDDEARQITHALLERQLAVCANWFPITCAYRWEGKIMRTIFMLGLLLSSLVAVATESFAQTGRTCTTTCSGPTGNRTCTRTCS